MLGFLSFYTVAVAMFALGFFMHIGLSSVGIPWLGSVAIVLLVFSLLVQAFGTSNK